MSHHYLNVVAATRWNNTSVIVGDRVALRKLRDTIDQALRTGAGGTTLFSSDGEPHRVAVVFEDNMYPVYTSYAYEPAPERSRRETMPIDKLHNYGSALDKASAAMAAAPAPGIAHTVSITY